MINSNTRNFWKDESIALLSLSSIEGLGYWSLWKIASSGYFFQDLLFHEKNELLLGTLKEFKVKAKLDNIKAISWVNYRKELWLKGKELFDNLIKNGVKIIHFNEDSYPAALKTIEEPPSWLFIIGNSDLLNETSVAIVGTRTPSDDGKFLAQYIGQLLPTINVPIVSGLANGVDQLIHISCLRFNIPAIAVLGMGIDFIFLNECNKIAKEILTKGGCIVTEYLPKQSYSKENFVRRNRIQAGLSRITIPIEWKIKSGTAHTVRYTYKFQRDLICLRLRDWTNHEELNFASSIGAKIYTIPDEQDLLISHINQSLKREMIPINKKDPAVQESLFEFL